MKTSRRLFNLVQGDTKFEVKASTDTASVYLYDEISYFGVTATDFVGEIMDLGGRDFNLHVNSPGGDVFEGLAMLNTLRAYPGKITAYVDGIAASAASFLVMGADEVVMCANSELMIHDAWGMCLGNAADMLDMAGRLDKVSDNIADVYRGKAGGSVASWRERMRAEEWYSPDEAVALGLAERALKASAPSTDGVVAYDLARFKNHRAVTAAPDEQDEPVDVAGILRAFEEALT